jgi:glutamine synthetase
MPFLDQMVHYLQELGWDINSFDHEGGNSQYELDFGYADALTTADRYIFLRLMLKEVAKRFDAFATFMPKPFSDNFGSGAHYNMSLADVDSGTNVFDAVGRDGTSGYTSLTNHFVAGILKHAPAITAITCPTANSYKRLVGRGYMNMISWAPVFVAYGYNNRCLMLRLPSNRRCVENRACDVAGNIYLGAALSLAAGLEGIQNQLDPGPAVNEDLYQLSRQELRNRGIATLPRTLLHAIEAFEEDALTEEVFGPLKPIYVELKNKEWEHFHNYVSDWETRTYLRFF